MSVNCPQLAHVYSTQLLCKYDSYVQNICYSTARNLVILLYKEVMGS